MKVEKNHLARAARKIGLTDSQADKLWQALQETESKSSFSITLLYLGAIIAFLSLFFVAIQNFQFKDWLPVSIGFAVIFFGLGSYLWYAKKLRFPGGVFFSLGIGTIPLIVYSLLNVMGFWPAPPYVHRFHEGWLLVEISTFLAACFVFYFIRFAFITVFIYLSFALMSLNMVHLYLDRESFSYITMVAVGLLFNFLGFILSRKGQKQVGFWGYLCGMFLLWAGLTFSWPWNEWGYFIYCLIFVSSLSLSQFFHRKIFMTFGTLGIVCYIGHLSYLFSNSLMFSFILGGAGFFLMMLAIFWRSKNLK